MLTESDRALLDRPLFGLLTVTPAAGRLPAPRPVWFEVTTQGTLQLFTLAASPRVRRLQAEPRASFVVAKPPGEPEGWLSVEADVTLHHDGAQDLAFRLTERYWDATQTEQRASARAMWEVEDLRRIILHPTRVTRVPA